MRAARRLRRLTAPQPVTLTATPDADWQFASWSGCSVSATTTNQCTVNMWQARTVTARFTRLPVYHALTINKSGNGQVSCGGGVCGPTYPADTT